MVSGSFVAPEDFEQAVDPFSSMSDDLFYSVLAFLAFHDCTPLMLTSKRMHQGFLR